MPTRPRERPTRLAEKLVQIRHALGLSQNGLLRRLGADDRLTREDVSKYERGLREPSLLVLLEYARVVNVWMDVLVDDELELPAKLPSSPRHKSLLRATRKRR